MRCSPESFHSAHSMLSPAFPYPHTLLYLPHVAHTLQHSRILRPDPDPLTTHPLTDSIPHLPRSLLSYAVVVPNTLMIMTHHHPCSRARLPIFLTNYLVFFTISSLFLLVLSPSLFSSTAYIMDTLPINVGNCPSHSHAPIDQRDRVYARHRA